MSDAKKVNVTLSIHVDKTLLNKETVKHLGELGIAVGKAANGMCQLSRALPKTTRDVRKFARFLKSIGVGSSLPVGFQMVHRGRGKYKIVYSKYDRRGMLRSTRRKVTS